MTEISNRIKRLENDILDARSYQHMIEQAAREFDEIMKRIARRVDEIIALADDDQLEQLTARDWSAWLIAHDDQAAALAVFNHQIKLGNVETIRALENLRGWNDDHQKPH